MKSVSIFIAKHLNYLKINLNHPLDLINLINLKFCSGNRLVGKDDHFNDNSISKRNYNKSCVVSMSESSRCRCLNCLKHFPVILDATIASCPNCKIKYRISWPWPGQPKIRGLAK